MEPSSQAFEQRDLPGIQDQVWTRIGADPDIQTHGGAESGKLIDAHGRQRAPFDPPDLRRRHGCGPCDRIERTPHPLAGVSQFGPDTLAILARQAATSVSGAFPGAHPSEHDAAGSTATHLPAGTIRHGSDPFCTG
jgi:hypothetical protein